jgi:hypothetical protein
VKRTSCTRCGIATPNSYRLCDECRTAETTANRAAAGLPPKITDPSDIAFVSRLLLSDTNAHHLEAAS